MVIERINFLASKGKLKFLKPLLPLFIIIQKINEKWFNKTVEYEEEDDEEEKKRKKY
ncbi:MAG: hypothetical protein KatS3mg068_0972 [Candidatus Sericytochromatia bacterium]|nr:MAG: hypothetical protein KatS3mg068_0972 [Candidatus Sericytochromatia bacterium]